MFDKLAYNITYCVSKHVSLFVLVVFVLRGTESFLLVVVGCMYVCVYVCP